MGLSQVDSAGPHEGELKGELFAGDHGPEGVFESLKGMMIAPPELSYYEQDENDGPDRLNQEVSSDKDWMSSTLIQGSEFQPDKLTHANTNLPK